MFSRDLLEIIETHLGLCRFGAFLEQMFKEGKLRYRPLRTRWVLDESWIESESSAKGLRAPFINIRDPRIVVPFVGVSIRVLVDRDVSLGVLELDLQFFLLRLSLVDSAFVEVGILVHEKDGSTRSYWTMFRGLRVVSIDAFGI